MNETAPKFPVKLICVCGEEWYVSPPKKYRTQQYLDETMERWRKKHGGCLKEKV